MSSAAGKPFLQIVQGDPSPEEVAALVAVLTARARAHAAAAAGGERRVSRWADRSRMLRGPVSEGQRPRGAGAWRASALPR
ncbi:acyl-CoA carboxylase subunit epsilon [Spirillospora sp. CA-255316]